MKKTIFWFLSAFWVFVMLVGCTDTEISSDSNTEDSTAEALQASPVADFEYEINEGKCIVKSYIGTDTDVVIPKIIDETPVTELSAMCFSMNRNIVSVYIPDSVTVIGGGAFAFCSHLITVRIPSELEIIGGGAFEGCGITDITLPNSLTKIGMRAFADCLNLKDIIIRKNTSYGEEAFCGSGLESIYIEEGVETISPSMFARTHIYEIVFPKSLRVIEMNAFGSCKNLESVTLNEGLTVIDTYAFAKTKITEIIIPQSVTELTDAVFMGCPNIQGVKFEGNAPNNYVSGLRDLPTYTIYYHNGATGFAPNEWSGYPTKLW